jgi:hypothetical protein
MKSRQIYSPQNLGEVVINNNPVGEEEVSGVTVATKRLDSGAHTTELTQFKVTYVCSKVQLGCYS